MLANPKAACIPDTTTASGTALLPFSIFLNRQKQKLRTHRSGKTKKNNKSKSQKPSKSSTTATAAETVGWCNLIEEFIVANPLSVMAAFDDHGATATTTTSDDDNDDNGRPLVNTMKLYPTILSRWTSITDPNKRQRNVQVLYELIRGDPTIVSSAAR